MKPKKNVAPLAVVTMGCLLLLAAYAEVLSRGGSGWPPVKVTSETESAGQVVVSISQGMEAPEAMRALADAIKRHPGDKAYIVCAPDYTRIEWFPPAALHVKYVPRVSGEEMYSPVTEDDIFRVARNGGNFSEFKGNLKAALD